MSNKSDEDSIWILVFILLALLGVLAYQAAYAGDPSEKTGFSEFVTKDIFYVL